MRLVNPQLPHDIPSPYMIFPDTQILAPASTRLKILLPVSHTLLDFRFLLSLMLFLLVRHLLASVSDRERLRLAQIPSRDNLTSMDEGGMRREMDLSQTYPCPDQDLLEARANRN